MPKLTQVTRVWKPTVKQVDVLNCIFVEKMGIREACQKTGISTAGYYKWFTHSEFVKYYDGIRNMHIKSQLHKVDKKMLEVASSDEKNNVAASRLLYEKSGEIHREEQKQPLTIIFQALTNGQIKRPQIEVKDITNGSENRVLPVGETK